jgi:phosphoenolpyruvate carboxykinase (GTP)
MLPFCGYNRGDYFAHWLRMGERLAHPPAIFHVNWFRTNAEGKFVWPGFGQNLRVLLWMIDRVKGQAGGNDTPVGVVPGRADLNWDGLELSPADKDLLLRVDRGEWAAEVPEIRSFFDKFGDRLPRSLDGSLQSLTEELTAASV